jgi:hypothetical protein
MALPLKDQQLVVLNGATRTNHSLPPSLSDERPSFIIPELSSIMFSANIDTDREAISTTETWLITTTIRYPQQVQHTLQRVIHPTQLASNVLESTPIQLPRLFRHSTISKSLGGTLQFDIKLETQHIDSPSLHDFKSSDLIYESKLELELKHLSTSERELWLKHKDSERDNSGTSEPLSFEAVSSELGATVVDDGEEEKEREGGEGMNEYYTMTVGLLERTKFVILKKSMHLRLTRLFNQQALDIQFVHFSTYSPSRRYEIL